MTAHQSANNFEFEFSTRGINGLLSLQLWEADTRELFWDINLDYYNEARLAYGTVPEDFQTFNGLRHSATQRFPTGGQKPHSLPPNGRFYVSITCQYDQGFAPCAGSFIFSLTTDATGRVAAVTRLDGLAADKFPKIMGDKR